ncbi:MAG: hypothetical protein OJF48_002511 [Afipia sp.]|jgi:histone H3/H4|nr:MAG: hypothetical protein OJF48_002511 [Afipia sp.]
MSNVTFSFAKRATPSRYIVKQTVDRVMKAFAQKHKAMTPEQERRVRDEVSDFVAELLEKRAAQLTKFGNARLRETEPHI